MRRKPLCILFTALAAAAVAARFFLYFAAIDPATGFYTEQYHGLGTAVSIVFAVLLIACVLSFRLAGEQRQGIIGRAPGLGVVSFGMAAALCYDAVMAIVRGVGGTAFGRDVTVSVLALLAAVFFVFQGVDRLTGSNRTPGLLYGLVPLWAAVKTVMFYTKFHGVVYISEGMLEVFALALVMMFWLYHARMLTGMNAGRAAQWGYGFGIAAAATCSMVTLPRLTALLLGKTELASHGSALEISLLVSVAYIILFLIRYHDAPQAAPDAEEEEIPAVPPVGAASMDEYVPQPAMADIDQHPAEESMPAVDDRIDRMVDELMDEKRKTQSDPIAGENSDHIPS